jgi:hypothetical protein
MAEENVSGSKVPQKGTKMDKWTPLVIAKLEETFGDDKKDRLCALLKSTGAVISGGRVLSAVADYAHDENTAWTNDNCKTDTDFYVPAKNIPAFLDEMVMKEDSIMKPEYANSYGASRYCNSFLRRNGIRKVYTFKTGTITRHRRARVDIIEPVANQIDVMAVRNARSPLDVVNNFDLTFCQVWFDGTDVYASHPEHIESKKGMLQGDYVKLMLTGNAFLKKRMAKYMRRGFTIDFDLDAVKAIAFKDLTSSRYNAGCSKPQLKSRVDNYDPVFLSTWMKQTLLKWTLDVDTSLINVKGENIKYLQVPGGNGLNQTDAPNDLLSDCKDTQGLHETEKFRHFKLKPDDGYDSDDMDEEKLKLLTVEKYAPAADAPVELAPAPIDPELIWRRSLFKLLRISVIPNPWYQDDYRNRAPNLAQLALRRGRMPHRDKQMSEYMTYMKDYALRTGTDMFENEGKLYDIHNHPLNGSITQEMMESYLEGHIGDVDKDAMPCYYQPNPHIHGQPVPTGNCKQRLTQAEIEVIVSPEFWARYSAPVPVKAGLNQIVTAYDAALFNTSSEDPAGYGDIFHETMCPFCLQFEHRDTGCAYMTHANPQKLPSTGAPFCQTDFAVQEIIDKYIAAGRLAEPDVPDHLEFCVVCGSPCWNHKHFDNTHPTPRLMPLIQDPGARHGIDYGKCQKGGRQELIARMLAVREIFKDASRDVPKEERRDAAFLADQAPRDPKLMARAAAILAKPEAERKWNDEIPAEKTYRSAPYGYTGEAPEPKALQVRPINAADVDVSGAAPPQAAAAAAAAPANAAAPAAAAPANAAAPAAAAPAVEAPLPNLPASPEARAWNQRALEFIEANINWDLPALAEQLQVLLDIGRAEQANIPEGQPSFIDVNLLNAIVILSMLHQGPQAVLDRFVTDAVRLGGGRVIQMIDPDLDNLMPNPAPAIAEFKRVLRMRLAQEQAQAPHGGARKTRRVKKGITMRRNVRRTR